MANQQTVRSDARVSEGSRRSRTHSARPRFGLSVDVLHNTRRGSVELEATSDHRLKIHASMPVRGTCGAHAFVYTRGDLDIVPAGASDRWHEEDASVSLILRLAPALLTSAAEELGLDPSRAGLAPRHQFKDAQVEHIAWALEAERSAGNPNGTLFAESMGYSLALHLLGHYGTRADKRRVLSKRQRSDLTEYIEQYLDRDLSLTKLAAVAGLSASHLKTLFKSTLGLTVHEYVVQRRVERAKELLLAGKLPAAQIALEAGFAHQSHMARCMRKRLGVTPSALTRP
jgi:AraC family transcriptional regulator